MKCLTDEQMELLVRNRAGWLRKWWWRRHLGTCRKCRTVFRTVLANESLLEEIQNLSRIDVQTPSGAGSQLIPNPYGSYSLFPR